MKMRRKGLFGAEIQGDDNGKAEGRQEVLKDLEKAERQAEEMGVSFCLAGFLYSQFETAKRPSRPSEPLRAEEWDNLVSRVNKLADELER